MGHTYWPTSISIDPNSGHVSYKMDHRIQLSYARMIPSMKARARSNMRGRMNELEHGCTHDQLYHISMILVPYWYQFGINLVSIWYQLGINLVSTWYQLGIILYHLWEICVFWRPDIIWSKVLRRICIWKIFHMNKCWIWDENKRTNTWMYTCISACVQL